MLPAYILYILYVLQGGTGRPYPKAAGHIATAGILRALALTPTIVTVRPAARDFEFPSRRSFRAAPMMSPGPAARHTIVSGAAQDVSQSTGRLCLYRAFFLHFFPKTRQNTDISFQNPFKTRNFWRDLPSTPASQVPDWIHAHLDVWLNNFYRLLLNTAQLCDFVMVEAYCVKCRDKREIKNPKKTKLKNGRPAVKGTCPECGTNVFRIGQA